MKTNQALPLYTERTDARDASPYETEWREELRRALRTTADLERHLQLTQSEAKGAESREAQGLPISITPYYASLINPADPNCPIRRQVVPQAEENTASPGDLHDPLGEVAHQVAPELIRRYPDRALLLATDRCAVYCRFCTRSRMVGQGGGTRSLEKLAAAFEYLENNPDIRDVIVSGGDVLAQSTDKIVRLIARLRAISSIETIRLATRVPVVLPQRITEELVVALRPFHPLWVMTHFNHPKELTALSRRALSRLVDHGFPVMNQTVLLRGVNDDATVLTQLFRGLVRERVKPYYLLQTDPVFGTGHLRTPIVRGVELMAELQGKLSGIAIPKLIVDTPGGHGKVPIQKNYVIEHAHGRTRLATPKGTVVDYWDPPL